MNRLIQLVAIGLISSAASAHESSTAPQAAGAAPAASANKDLSFPAGAASRAPTMTVKRNSQLTRHAEGSVQTDTDTYTTTTEFVHITTVYAYNLAGELVDMKMSEIRTPRT
ncbi:MAG: hypothetical protein AB1584_21070 [Pseudomonadota bacterium]